MAFSTPQEWRALKARVQNNEVELERLLRLFFEDKFLGSADGAFPGDPTYTERPLTNQEKNAIRARVVALCNAQSNEYLSAIT